MKLFRYDQEFYIFDGRIDEKILTVFSMFSIVEKKEIKEINNCEIVIPVFYIPVSLANKITNILSKIYSKIEIILINQIEDYLYYGDKDEQAILNSVLYFIDDKGNYIYLLDSSIKECANVKLLKNHPTYLLSSMELSSMPPVNKDMFIEDYMINTDFSIDDKYKEYVYSDNKYLNIYKIINRMILSKKAL